MKSDALTVSPFLGTDTLEPYLQSARAIYLKALKDTNSFKFHSELKITAAYSTERNVLFDFITDQEIIESKVSLDKVDESNEEKKSFVDWLSISNFKPIDRSSKIDDNDTGGGSRQRVVKGSNLRVRVSLTLEEIANGVEKKIKVKRKIKAPCINIKKN